MTRDGVKGLVMVVLALVLGCIPKQKEAESVRVMEGPIDLILVNKTKQPIENAVISNSHYQKEQLIGMKSATPPSRYGPPPAPETNGPPIAPGAAGSFKLKADTYTLTARSPKENAAVGADVLSSYKIELTGPLQIVLYDTEQPPTDVAPAAGVKQVVVLSYAIESERRAAGYQAQRAADNQAAKAARDAEYARCKKAVAPTYETPAPGKTKIDGTWTCVATGGASATNTMKLNVLADGKINGIVLSGPDRNNAWEGIMKGDELRFRFTGLDQVGGILKVDPGGKAMKGNCSTWTPNSSTCLNYVLTCSR